MASEPQNFGDYEGRSAGMSVSDWAEQHGMIQWLVPFSYRSVDPFAVLETVDEYTSNLRPLKQSFTRREMAKETDLDLNSVSMLVPKEMLEFCGSWKLPGYDGGQQADRWVNPNYAHIESCADLTGAPGSVNDERYEVSKRYARWGIFRAADLAPRFGMASERSAADWMVTHDVPWREWRYEGYRRIARTIRVANLWTGHSEYELAAMMPCGDGTIRRLVQEYVREDGWIAPDDPTAPPSTKAKGIGVGGKSP